MYARCPPSLGLAGFPARVAGHRGIDREATVGTNREGHRGLAERHILGGMQREAQERSVSGSTGVEVAGVSA